MIDFVNASCQVFMNFSEYFNEVYFSAEPSKTMPGHLFKGLSNP